ncbi:AGAP012131-PA-like protein [Anopheles sinensis]|uniref:AGAP012131-PA-like protein n=1 Tax=Anopheles sinensis TaxID=74873 RepID=A0A084WM66_ANOSI|nr:AGAP012131-PA-like protein [Anopheles sinensis]
MNVFQLSLIVVLCGTVGVTRGQGSAPSFSFADGIVDARCPSNDNPMNPMLLAVPNDCSKFQKCYNGRAFTISCPAGQEFGVHIQRCDFPMFAQCRQGFVQPQPAAFRYEEGNSDSRCPRFDDPFNPTHLAHPTDCRRFYKCFDGRAFELQCPMGQEWGKELNRCDYPTLARCSVGRQDRPDTAQESVDLTASVEKPEEEEDVDATVEKEYIKPAKAEFTYSAGVNDLRCPKYDDPYRPVHLAHPGDCRKFLKCFDGRAYTIDCPPGQEFGIRINRCDYPQFAQCSAPKARKSLRKAAAPAYDDSYYYYDDDEFGNDVPLDSAEWTPEQREMIAGVPDTRCPDKDDPAEPLHFIHPRDCGKFYKCYSGRAFLINCPIGQHWSVRYDRCDYPKVAKCTIRGS